MHFTADRKGNVFCENSFQDRFLEKIYCHKAGRILLKPFLLPVFSKAGGKLLIPLFPEFLLLRLSAVILLI